MTPDLGNLTGSIFYAPEQPCRGCGKPLELANAWMEDGCPCNSLAGVNNLNAFRWYLLQQLQQQQSRELEESKASFDLRWKADQRAIKRWHDAGNDMSSLPDHADLVVWLLERLTEAERERDELRAADLCECGHGRAAHQGHTHLVGTPEPSHCSQGCGCRAFRSRAAVPVELLRRCRDCIAGFIALCSDDYTRFDFDRLLIADIDAALAALENHR